MVAYGVINCGVLHKFEYGYNMGKLSQEIYKRFPDKSKKPMVQFIFANFIQHCKEHIRETLPYMLASYQDAVDVGDLIYLGHSASRYCCHCFFSGMNLSKIDKKIRKYLPPQQQAKQGITLNTTIIIHQMVLNLMERTDDPCKLVGELRRNHHVSVPFGRE
jgi:predicted ATPase